MRHSLPSPCPTNRAVPCIFTSRSSKKVQRTQYILDRNGRNSSLFRSYIAGLARLLPQVTPLFAPNVNSFRRMRPDTSAPINVQWGADNRSCGLRIPVSKSKDRRIENRLPGADANPSVAIASSLVCGYIDMVERMRPPKTSPAMPIIAPELFRALWKQRSTNSATPAGPRSFDRVFDLFYAIKEAELFAYQSVISSWEREHLLLRV